MTTEVRTRTTIEGWVDGKKVVSAYRAFAEDKQPYCISFHLQGVTRYATFEPTQPDEEIGIDQRDADEFNLRQVTGWVETLTELIEKAQYWDDFVTDIEQIADDENAPGVPSFDNGPAYGDGPVSVDHLTDDEADKVWQDSDGDRYKWIDGDWHIKYIGYPVWERDEDTDTYLRGVGPYVEVRPREVEKLTESERDAVWSFTGENGKQYNYRWNDDTVFNGIHPGSWEAQDQSGNWWPIGSQGPQLGSASARLVEVL